MSPSVITTEHLCRDFGPLHAVREVDLDIPPGIIYGFLGPNGSGKTTTIRLLLGLLEPTAGTARVLGYDCRTQSDRIRERTGALLEHPGLYERLSAWDNLEFHGRIYHIPRHERRLRIQDVLRRLGLWERRDEPVGTWSRGMKQKLGVARSLLHRPALVFLDEPTSGLDPLAAASLRADLSALVASEGLTVFLTTHNLVEAESVCARVGVIHRGRLVAEGSPAELKAKAGRNRVELSGSGIDPALVEQLRLRPDLQRAELVSGILYLELSDDGSMAPIVRLLVEAGVGIEEVRRGRATLEEAFLNLVRDTDDFDGNSPCPIPQP
jgi:ABC-2 type transport system ATP-binding protein